MYAVMHVAIHDALNAIDRRSVPTLWTAEQAGASPDAAVAAAARDVLVTLLTSSLSFPGGCCAAGVASVEADYAAALARSLTVRPRPRRLGRTGRGCGDPQPQGRGWCGTPLTDPGYPRAPSRRVAFHAWFRSRSYRDGREVTPFVLRGQSQFRPGPPYAVTGRKYAADFDEVKELGGDDLPTPSARTAEQTEIARFWLETSPLQWNRIARIVSADRPRRGRTRGCSGCSTLRSRMATSAAGRPSTSYNYWRPVTAIQAADTDGNPDTSADPDWTPLVPTPPIRTTIRHTASKGVWQRRS